VVLPKPIRDRLGLREGAALQLSESAGSLILTKQDPEPSLVRKGRFLVHTGELPRNFDILKALNEEREDRDRMVLGL
jgi:AbrB family looped-hinge helix DNA binding protein